MEFISFILAIFFSLGTHTMFCSSLVTPSPMQEVTIVLTFIMFLLALLGVRITYKEFMEVYHGNKK